MCMAFLHIGNSFNHFFFLFFSDRAVKVCTVRPQLNLVVAVLLLGFPDGSVVKNPPANEGDLGFLPEWERSPEEENGFPSYTSVTCALYKLKHSDRWYKQNEINVVKVNSSDSLL